MATRFVVGAALVATLAGVFALDTYVFAHPFASRVVLWLLALGGLHEAIVLGGRRIECNPGLFVYGGVAVVVIVVPALVMREPVSGALLALAAVVAAGIRLLGMAPLRSAPAAFPEAVLLAAALLYTAGLLSFLDRILVEGGLRTAYAVLAISKVTDILGYVVGKAVGRRRLAPALSPKKTWEGAIAGILGCVGAGALLAPELVGTPLFAGLIGALVGLGSILGDLAESGLKRWADRKDSGALLPEFGGFLDLLDGILVAAPVAVICLFGA